MLPSSHGSAVHERFGRHEAEVRVGKSLLHAGKLLFTHEPARQHSAFIYDRDWTEDAKGFALAPDLPLGAEAFYNSPALSGDQRDSLHGVFQDAAPDSWGRMLLERLYGRGLTEFAFLTLADDATRQGALRFCDDKGRIITGDSPAVPRLINLEELRSIAAAVERRSEVPDEDLRRIAGAGGSIGGARPKANVLDGTDLWIAKFSSESDTDPVERIEVATLKLARAAGLNAPDARLMLEQTPSPAALIRRFDRDGEARIPYISARTALGRHGAEHGSYSEIADFIREHSLRPSEDLLELWLRIVFTILVTNTDDHLKNHGFVYAGNGMWSLSKLFDVNPRPERQRLLKTAIIDGEPFKASIDLALEAAAFFDINDVQARKRAGEMARKINGEWKDQMRNQGVSGGDLRNLAPAFEHAEMDCALAF